MKMKKLGSLILMLVLVCLLSGCTLTDVYSVKNAYVLAKGTSSGEISKDLLAVSGATGYSADRKAAFLLAERSLKYHYGITDNISGTANIAYNLSYILNLPAKLYRNIQVDLGIGKLSNHSDDMTGAAWQIASSKASAITLILLDIWYAVIGLVSALLMLIFGTLIGLFNHPIRTILDIPALLWGLVKTLYYAIAHFFYW
ncbi:hypothetical protein D7Z26_22710 [Cohnella endophytica]|uniref:Uncharacterized protein n=1 Tax=Cohnella endophytica TaxID=2419778 RepID=A0A494XB80_9BACL|nr:hypothetical protein [Cohnella endophytica]RKP48015.1 hypothetical protein D7Z26_22710 [Cohnella endophytica]